ncbi:major facilitator superfamily domain-containing protein 3 isoform X2 [Gadus macrocephalus]|uniref:major facilitator superfamily domain-containing protein 3 isoform X2 n=1 Tax=Gadus macrocephalus TaxID=80720 RepID=UPI0028CBACE1|nr:major facilitator superfamily domain-containing protein 3 isoform X2 [Gadus macrocephalus]
MGHMMNDKLVFLGLLYFVQGIPYGLQSSLLPVYLRGAGHSLTRIGFTKILYFPWVLKVLWAPLIDRIGSKRRWLVGTVSGLALTCVSSALLAPESHIWAVAGTLLVMNALASVQDIAVDGAAVGLLKSRGELGLGNTAQVVGYKAGSVFAGGGLLAVIDVAGWSWMFLLLTFVYAGVALFVWGAPVLDEDSLRCQQQTDGGRRGGSQGADIVRPWRVWRKMLAVPGTPWTVLYVLTYKLGALFNRSTSVRACAFIQHRRAGGRHHVPSVPAGPPHDGQGAGLLERRHRHGLLHLRLLPRRRAARTVQHRNSDAAGVCDADRQHGVPELPAHHPGPLPAHERHGGAQHERSTLPGWPNHHAHLHHHDALHPES